MTRNNELENAKPGMEFELVNGMFTEGVGKIKEITYENNEPVWTVSIDGKPGITLRPMRGGKINVELKQHQHSAEQIQTVTILSF